MNKNWEKYARNTAYRQEEDDYFTAQVFRSTISWLDRNKNLKDFFLMIDAFDPHEPFDPPEEYARLYNPDYTGDSVVWPKYGNTDGLSEAELAQIHALYCGEITFIDKWFGKMMDKLQETGLLDNTMVIVTSDHGFLFGEHDWIGKHSKTLYNHIAHTPLVIYHPDAKAKRVQDLVQMADLYPTILQAMDVPAPEEIEAKSILPAVVDQGVRQQPLRESLIYGVFGGSVYLTDGQWMYVRRPQKSGPLYWYTRSHFQSWQFGQKLDLADTRARAELLENGRIPVRIKQEWLNAANPGACPIDLDQCEITCGDDAEFEVLQDELYSIVDDYEQQHNVIDRFPEVAERMRSYLRDKFDELHAPEEQYVRMGL
jgi:arylsulfatase A-like enzyme